MRCCLCSVPCEENLCSLHNKQYVFESSIEGFRLRQTGHGSRYTRKKYHKNEILLTKIIEKIYGKENVVTSFHPLWAVSLKHVLYEYDIHVRGTKLLIEYFGSQHYEKGFFNRTDEEFEYQKFKDWHKRGLAEHFGYSLIIFKYDEPIILDYVKQKIDKQIGEIKCI